MPDDGGERLPAPSSAEGRTPWRDVPELRDLDDARAKNAYERAWSRTWRSGRTWAAAGLAAAVVGVYVLFIPDIRPAGWKYRILGSLARGVLNAAVGAGAALLFFKLTRSTLRRCVRAELGTHCAGCDYDLRATPDLPPPAVTRCPECGRKIPRNVHRRTISAPDSSGAQRPPEFRGP